MIKSPGTVCLSLNIPVVLQVTCVQPFTSGQRCMCLDGCGRFLSPSGHAESLEGVGASSSLGISPTNMAGPTTAALQLRGNCTGAAMFPDS